MTGSSASIVSSSPCSATTACGKSEASSRVEFDERLQTLGGVEPRARDRDAERGDLLLGGREPARIRAGVLEQPVAAPERLLEFGDARAMLGIDAKRQAVEEAPPVSGGSGEEPVHRRGEPDDLETVREGARRGDRQAVQAKAPALAGLIALPELRGVAFRLELDRDAKAAGSAVAGAVLALGAAQPAPRREHGEGFEEIGLAGAVLARQRHEARGEASVERFVGAKVAQHQPPDQRAAGRSARV